MELSSLYMMVGFLFAAWSVVANDSIQTLGTFLASNDTVKWYWLFAATAGVMVITLGSGWYMNGGDMAFGRLDKIPLPITFTIWHAIAPVALLILTRYGLPVSTTFLVLSVFASEVIMTKMILKSALGYGVSFVAAFVIWKVISWVMDEHIPVNNEHKQYWRIGQWVATMFLWSQWLAHDMANIAVYLPRTLDFWEVTLVLLVLSVFLAIIFKQKGGKIQDIVLQKSGTRFIRSATIIDFVFAFMLWFFKELNGIPMSTTWVFVGLLAGRELAIHHLHNKDSHVGKIFPMLIIDFLKVMAGLIFSVLLALAVVHL